MGIGTPKMPSEFNWMSFVDVLANGDITKYEAVYELEYQLCLHKLLFDHHRDKYNREMNRRIELQNKYK